jgi:hypothetical protein
MVGQHMHWIHMSLLCLSADGRFEAEFIAGVWAFAGAVPAGQVGLNALTKPVPSSWQLGLAWPHRKRRATQTLWSLR